MQGLTFINAEGSQCREGNNSRKYSIFLSIVVRNSRHKQGFAKFWTLKPCNRLYSKSNWNALVLL